MSKRRYFHKAQYRLDRILSKGMMAQLGLLAIAALIVIVVGMTVSFVGLFDSENAAVESIHHTNNDNFWDAFWWALTHALDPGTFVANYGATLPVTLFAFVLTIIGMALFGTFIGLVSAGIHERLRLLDQGISPVVERGHVLILGWNHLAPAVIARLVGKREKNSIVVLADRDIEDMRQDLRTSLEIDRQIARRIVFRQGSVIADHELERVSYRHAARIIILSNERSDLDPTANDIDAVKLLMMFSDNSIWEEERPHIVAEISDPSNLEVANLAGRHQVPVVTSSDQISRIIAQCSRQPELSQVYFELFSTGSNQLVMEQVADCTGLAFGEILNRFKDASPIGVCDILELDDRVVHIPDLNPPADHVIEAHEKIILISSTGKAEFLPDGEAFDKKFSGRKAPDIAAGMRHVIILGWNRNIYTMLAQYDEYMPRGGEVHIVSALPPEEADRLIAENLNRPLANIKCLPVSFNYLKKPHLAEMMAAEPDAVIVLSDESVPSESPDSRVIMALVLLQRIIEDQGGGDNAPHVVAEILDKSSMDSLDFFSGFEMVVTPDIVSQMLARIARRNDIRTVATELLSPNGQEVLLKPADTYLQPGKEFRFGDLVASGKNNGEIIWGIIRAGKEDGGGARENRVEINPDRTKPMTLGPNDKLITLGELRE